MSVANKLPGALAGINILVVDDSKELRSSLEALLSAKGATVVTAVDGMDAITKAKTSEFHLVLMDLRMPGVDGEQAATQINKFHHTKKIVALTGDLNRKNSSSLQAIFDDLLFKPINPSTLSQYVAGLCSTEE